MKSLLNEQTLPQNCDFLSSLRVNDMIWQKCSPRTQSFDAKCQIVQNCIANSGNNLIQMLDRLGKMVKGNKELGEILQIGTQSVAFLGHGFRELALRRRELIKPDLNPNFTQLCHPSVQFTDQLFGDEVDKQLQTIQSTNKLQWQVGRGRGSNFRRRFSHARHHPYQPSNSGNFQSRPRGGTNSNNWAKGRPNYNTNNSNNKRTFKRK